MTDFNASEAKLSTCLFTKSSMGWLCHRRLGHVEMKQLNKLIKHDLVRGLKDVTFEKDKLCSVCQARKQVGHVEHYCKNKNKDSNVSLIKFDSCYLLTKGANSVKAKFVGAPIVGSKKKAIWVPKSLVANLQVKALVWF